MFGHMNSGDIPWNLGLKNRPNIYGIGTSTDRHRPPGFRRIFHDITEEQVEQIFELAEMRAVNVPRMLSLQPLRFAVGGWDGKP